MSWSMADVKAGLGEALADLNLRVYSEAVPEKIVVPCVVVGEGDIDYAQTFDDCDELSFGLMLIVSRADSRTGQRTLGEYRQRSGSLSIISALEATPTLPYMGTATADSVEVKSSTAPQTVEIAGVTYLASEFTIGVLVA